MAKGNKAGAGAKKPSRATGYRLRPELQAVVEALAARQIKDATDVVNDLVRDSLDHMGLLPDPTRLGELVERAAAMGVKPKDLLVRAIAELLANLK